MNSCIQRTLAAVFGAFVLLGGLTACGHRPDGSGWQIGGADHGRVGERMVERVAARLNLTPEQKERLGVLADRLREQRVAVAGEGGDRRAQSLMLVAGDRFDRPRAQALVSAKTAAVNARSPEVIAALGDFYDSLDPAQQGKVREFLQHRRHRWWQRG